MVELIHGDCMDYMRVLPDKAFELAIVDPPYGIGISSNPVRQLHAKKKWDNSTPCSDYFTELFRVSINQIIWGGNYFDLPPSQGFIIWDKVQPHGFTLAMCELAWISFQKPAKIWKKSVLSEQRKIHPTQKPIALYKWLLHNYAQPGNRILDTHLGSGSSAIAAHQMGFDFVGIELDQDYYNAACKRFKEQTAQLSLL